MSRAKLVAACRAQRPHSVEWETAVRALGAASCAGFPEAKKPSRSTGLSRGELFARMLKSHVFDPDRAAWQQRWWHFPSATTFDEMKQALEARKATEKLAVVAA